jgi:hypothetical protein
MNSGGSAWAAVAHRPTEDPAGERVQAHADNADGQEHRDDREPRESTVVHDHLHLRELLVGGHDGGLLGQLRQLVVILRRRPLRRAEDQPGRPTRGEPVSWHLRHDGQPVSATPLPEG